MAGGRPRIIESPEELEQRVLNYQAECFADEKRMTLTGMILALGLHSRDSLDEYGKRPEFSDSVKWAKMFIEEGYEQNLHGSSAAGSIFALKNFGWKDQQHIEQNMNIKAAVMATEMDAEEAAKIYKELMDG